MRDRILDFSDVIADVFDSNEGSNTTKQPTSRVRPVDPDKPRKGDTMPCPASDPNAEPVKRGPISVEIEEAGGTVYEMTQATANDVKLQVPTIDDLCHEVLRDQYVSRFLQLGKIAPGRLKFLPLLWELQREMANVPEVAVDVFDAVAEVLKESVYVVPGPAPLEERQWQVIWIQFLGVESGKSPRIIARNLSTGVGQPVKIYDVLRGLEVE